MTDRPALIKEKKLLLVEGSTDGHFCGKLLKKMGISGVRIEEIFDNLDEINIVAAKGINKFKMKLENLKLVSGFSNVERIAILADADENPPNSVFEEIRENVLKPCGFAAPEKLNELSDGHPKIIIHIISCKEKGCLESLCLEAVSQKHAIPAIQKFEEEINNYQPRFRPECLYKAKLQVYLAAMRELVHYPALGVPKGYFDLESNVFNSLKNFLEKFTS